MTRDLITRNKYTIGVVAVYVTLIWYKARFLSLPYYWDEAWPYAVAVRTLHHHGLSFMPTAIPAEISRGHPLMFHFLAAAWMKIFGTSLFSGHSFALMISLCTGISIFLFCRHFFSSRVAFISTLLFCVQPIFIAQSVFLLPEMMVALGVVLSFYSYYSGKFIAYLFITAATILTKESGGVIIVALAMAELHEGILYRQPRIEVVKRILIVIAPTVLAAVYFIIQKIVYGWFLFPFYMNYISSQWTAFKANLPSEFSYIFIYYGRNGLSAITIVSVFILVFKKIGFSRSEQRVMRGLVFFLITFLLFSSINYYIPRYLLCAFPSFIICATIIIDKVFLQWKRLYILAVVGMTVTAIYYYTSQNKVGDGDYSPSVNTYLSAVKLFEELRLQDSSIYAPSVMRIDLKEPWAGYLSGRSFSNLQWEPNAEAKYCVFTSDEQDFETFRMLNDARTLVLLKEFKEGYAWCRVYKVVTKAPRVQADTVLHHHPPSAGRR